MSVKPKSENVVTLAARREAAPATLTPHEIYCRDHRPGDPVLSLREVDPAAYQEAFMKGWVSATSLDEYEMIGRLKAKWNITVTSGQARVWRHRGQGPIFYKAGAGPHARVWYFARDVDLWAEFGTSRPAPPTPPVPPSPK